MKRSLAVFILAVALTGCANLDEVRQFAGESAKLGAYTELTTNFRETFAREEPYLSGPALETAKQNDQQRAAAYADLLAVHETVSLYMLTLARLAGSESFDLSARFDALKSEVKAHPELGFDAGHAGAVAGIGKTIARWMSERAQAEAVQDMIRAGNAPLQQSLDGMSRLLRAYRKTHGNERQTVLGLYDSEFALAQVQPKDRLLMALARKDYLAKRAEFAAKDTKFDAAEAAIREVAAGHAHLYENVDALGTPRLKEELAVLTQRIRTLTETIRALH